MTCQPRGKLTDKKSGNSARSARQRVVVGGGGYDVISRYVRQRHSQHSGPGHLTVVFLYVPPTLITIALPLPTSKYFLTIIEYPISKTNSISNLTFFQSRLFDLYESFKLSDFVLECFTFQNMLKMLLIINPFKNGLNFQKLSIIIPLRIKSYYFYVIFLVPRPVTIPNTHLQYGNCSHAVYKTSQQIILI